MALSLWNGSNKKSPKYSVEEEEFLKTFDRWLTQSSSSLRRNLADRRYETARQRFMGLHWTPGPPGTRVRVRNKPGFNHVARVVETMVPLLTDSRPIMEAQAKVPENEPFAAGMNATLGHLWDYNEMDSLLPEALKGALLFGTYYGKATYDPFASGGVGEVTIGIIDPTCLIYDCEASSSLLSSCRYLIEKIPVNTFFLQTHFEDAEFEDDRRGYQERGQGGPRIPMVGSNVTDSSGKVGTFYGTGNDRYQKELTDDDSWYYECWWRDTDYPNGRMATIYRGKLLKPKYSTSRIIDNPHPAGKFPYCKLTCYDVPGEILGKSAVHDVIPLHDELNYQMGQLIDYIDFTAYPEKIIPKTAGLDEKSKKESRPGKITEPATPQDGDAIRYLAHQGLDSAVMEGIHFVRQAIDEASGIYDSIQGKRAIGTVSGRAQSLLQDASMTRIRLIERNMERWLSQLGMMAIELTLEYTNEPRILRLLSRQGQIEYHQIIPHIMQDEDGKPMKRFELTTSYNVKPSMKEGRVEQSMDGGTEYESEHRPPVTSTYNPEFDVRVISGSGQPINKAVLVQQLADLADKTAQDHLPYLFREHVLQPLQGIIDVHKVLSDVEKFKKENSPGPPPPQKQVRANVTIDASKLSPPQIRDALAVAEADPNQQPQGAPGAGNGVPSQP